MKKPSLLLLFFYTFLTPAFSQEVDRDALLSQLKQETNDSIRFQLMRDLGYSYEYSDSTMAMKYYKQNLTIAKKRDDCEMLSRTYTDIGNVLKNGGRYKEARENHLLALSYGIKCESPRLQAIAYANLGNIFLLTNQDDSSAYYLLKSGKMFEEDHDTARCIQVYSNVSSTYYRLHQYQNAIDLGKKCIVLCKGTGDVDNLASSYILLAASYKWLNDLQSANENLNLAITIAPQMQNVYFKANVYQNIASYLLDIKELKLGLQYADSSVILGRELQQPSELLACLMVQGAILIKMEEFDKAEPIINEALDYAKKDGEWFGLRELYLYKSQIEFHRKNYQLAYEYLDTHLVYKDSLFNEDVASKTNELNAKYRNAERLRDIDRLEKENELSSLKAAQQQRLKYLFIGFAILGAVTSALFYINFKRKFKIKEQSIAINIQRIKELENESQMIAMDAIIKGEEKERSRVAKDLHDGLGSLLSGVKLSLSSMKGNVIISEKHANLFNSSLSQLDNAINEMRRVAHNMMPESLMKFGLTQAVQNLCDGLNESETFKAHLELYNVTTRLNSDQEITVYRMIQELVNNALKHAKASNIIIQLSQNDGKIHLVVEDDGVGFDVKSLKQSEGSGYNNLRHRLNYLKGTMDIQSDPGKGTSVLMEFPFE